MRVTPMCMASFALLGAACSGRLIDLGENAPELGAGAGTGLRRNKRFRFSSAR